jgi:hypothetical protein
MMATASLSHVVSAGYSPASAPPAWWRRAHSYSLPVVVVAEVSASWAVIRIAEVGSWTTPLGEILTASLLGMILAQCFLLGLWAALGGLPTVLRWLIVGVVYVAGATLVSQALFEGDWLSFLEVAPEFLLLGGILMSAFAALLLPMRRLAAWRVDFDAAYHRGQARPRGQVGMMDFAAMFCAVALPLALSRVLLESSPDEGPGVLVFILMFAFLVFVVAAPVTYAALAQKRVLLSWLAAVAWIVALAWAQSALAHAVPEFDPFDLPIGVAGLRWTILAFYCGIGASIALPLFALRLCGLKLLRVA